jgi:hypothetical protein
MPDFVRVGGDALVVVLSDLQGLEDLVDLIPIDHEWIFPMMGDDSG